MTMEQLSEHSVKIQLSDSEMKVFLQGDDGTNPNSPQMMRLIAFLIAKAELFCDIPFSQGKVAVEQLPALDGGVVYYFTSVHDSISQKSILPKYVHLAAAFDEYENLRSFCQLIKVQQIPLIDSSLFQAAHVWYFFMLSIRKNAEKQKHLLMEYGLPISDSHVLRAWLDEHGTCIYPKNASAKILNQSHD